MSNLRIVILTELGEFEIELDPRAKETAAYFQWLAAEGGFSGAEVFRIVSPNNGGFRPDTPIEVVQIGWKDQASEWVRPLAHESTELTGLSHKKWSISTAREGVGEAYASFFICMRDEPELDYGGARHPDGQGFAVFGRVVSGFEAVETLYGRAEATEYLERPVNVLGAKITSKA